MLSPKQHFPSETDHKKCEMNVIDYYLQKTQLKLQVSMFYVVFMLFMLRFWHFPFRVTDMCNNFKYSLCVKLQLRVPLHYVENNALAKCWRLELGEKFMLILS